MVYYNMFDKNLIYGILISILILCIYHIVSCQCNDSFQVGGEKYGGKHGGKHGGKQQRKLEKEIIQLEREILQLEAGNAGNPIMCDPISNIQQFCPDGSLCPDCGEIACPCPLPSPAEECDPNNDNNGGGCPRGKCCWGNPPICQDCGDCNIHRDCPENKVCDKKNCIDPPPVDCVGHWDDDDNCDINCERKYVVDTPASNGGIQCEANDGEKKKNCQPNQGKCLVKPPVDCGGVQSKKLTNGITVIPKSGFYHIEELYILNTDLDVNGTLCIDKPFNINEGGKLNINGTINILSNGKLNINPGGHLAIVNNKGNLNNTGTITNKVEDFYNSGRIDNDGTIYNIETIKNYGTITNGGRIDNSGFLQNIRHIYNNGDITNNLNATIYIYGGDTYSASGSIHNFKTIKNYGTITNDGDIGNDGKICGNDIQNKPITGNPVDPNC
jgi:hypothetical protein